MSTRVYVGTTWTGLRDFVTADGLGPAPFYAHAVTRGVRAAWPDGDDEGWEYAATAAAARTSLGLLTDEDPPRRVVLAIDAETVIEADDPVDPSVVEVGEVVPMRLVAAVLVDTEDAADDVTAAREAWPRTLEGDADAEAVVDRCLDRDLAWFALQEVGELLTWE
jgi:hypothetical protein